MSTERVHVIACGVLAVDIRHLAGELKLELTTTYLPGGLHNNPRELRSRLQATIDEVSRAGEATRIAIGYGVCGRGSVGIHARGIPLAIPRVHDCISLFLGSDAAYRREFSRYPGTYYISAGWVQEKVQPKSASDGGEEAVPGKPRGMADPCPADGKAPGREGKGGDGCGCADPEFERLVAQYGGENAEAIRHFLSSWQRNYQRAAFIDTGAPEHHRYAELARTMAQRHGWKYEQLRGSGELLKKLLLCQGTSSEVLWVPPHHVTVYDPVGRGLDAAPVWAAAADERRDEVIEIGADAEPAEGRARLGLGIDAGGTYTDVAIYDFTADRVLQKAKALTTKWDYTIGISAALDQLEAASLRQVDLVSISTTLATNAIVEGRGQKVGLLVMPPYGLFAPEDIAHSPVRVIQGQLDIDGSEKRAIDPLEIARVARQLIDEEQVGAFAVTGYASHINPAHELAVRQVLQQQTTLPVTCGHEVSDQLNYRVRAHTAALNGRIIPILTRFLEQAQVCLRGRGIEAPTMVVRSDGSLMSVSTARQRPIETILSGPAASVAGARYLAKIPSAFVVDVGGTTTDTAYIRGGEVRTTRHGARVGGWQTHVQALDMRTIGLGGDSVISVHHGELKIGPRRVAPIAWLAEQVTPEQLEPCFRWIEEEAERHGLSSGLLDIYALNGKPELERLHEREQRIVQALAERPFCARELASHVQRHWGEQLDFERLEREHLVHHCGLTPTDILHVAGLFQRWNTQAAQRLAQVLCLALKLEAQRLVQRVMDLAVRGLAMEVLKKQLDEQVEADGLDRSKPARAMLENWLTGGSGDFHVRVQLKCPVIGIGAPVGHFLPAAAKLLETQAIVPEHADVANAIGAITSSVMIRRQVEISPEVDGRFALHGVPGTPVFAEMKAAREAAMEALKASVMQAAREAGTSQGRIRFTVHDRIAPLGDGSQAFVGQTIEARLTGRPDLARLAQSA